MKDEVAMNVLRLESRVAAVIDYLARLKVATSRIDTTLWPRETLQNDLESLMTRLNEVPSRVQEWKKVANTKKHDFRSFMETFIAAATRIADGIDLDEFVAPSTGGVKNF